MGRPVTVACIAGALAALAAVVGCDGKVIRLGEPSTPSDGGACPHVQVPAGQVLWIGDSWQLLPAGQEAHTLVQSMARAAGAIGQNDVYTVKAAAASTIVAIEEQYITQEAANGNVKVVIMDGGTWDTINNNANSTELSATVTAVINNFTELLSTVASNQTVTDVVYFLMPSDVPGVDELRPGLEAACTSSAVPCHFIDLQTSWSAGDDTGGTIPVPTAAGAAIIAQQIWATMQAHCIAQ
jgi:hypothetical protein